MNLLSVVYTIESAYVIVVANLSIADDIFLLFIILVETKSATFAYFESFIVVPQGTVNFYSLSRFYVF